MYVVVGCGECDALWVVEGRPETTGCPRCGTRHRFDRLKRFVETDHEDRARQARARLLAERSGHGEAFAEVGSFEELDARLDDAGVSDEEYLAGSGLDVDAIEAAGEQAGSGFESGGGSRLSVVKTAIRELDDPTDSGVVDYASERGIPPDAARTLLERLVEAGDVTTDGDRYRLL